MKIVKYPAKSLGEKCVDIELVQPNEKQFLDDFKDFVKDLNCLGLAAPQVGRNLRVFLTKASMEPKVYINPVMIKKSSRTYETKEGCLSLEEGKLYPVKRHYTVKMEWYDGTGRKRRETLQGLEAQVVQHEYDHLEGIMLNDYEKENVLG